jgi:hypothetical protein
MSASVELAENLPKEIRLVNCRGDRLTIDIAVGA